MSPGDLDPALVRRPSVAGFRNVIVHGYLEIDVALLHWLLNELLEDFSAFARFVERHLSDPKRSDREP